MSIIGIKRVKIFYKLENVKKKHLMNILNIYNYSFLS